jgi:hypothetical protein
MGFKRKAKLADLKKCKTVKQHKYFIRKLLSIICHKKDSQVD